MRRIIFNLKTEERRNLHAELESFRDLLETGRKGKLKFELKSTPSAVLYAMERHGNSGEGIMQGYV